MGAAPEVSGLVHNEGDHVAVAVADVDPGVRAIAWLDSGRRGDVEVIEAIPLGHKVALVNLGEAEPVLEYGVRIGLTRSAIAAGTLVHTHNIRSARWTRSG